MFLQDSFADVKLSHIDGYSLEVWWLNEGGVLAVSHCPTNYPALLVHTMTVRKAVGELRQLTKEGWEIERCSEKFLALCSGKLQQRITKDTNLL